MSHIGQVSEADRARQSDKGDNDQILHDSAMEAGGEMTDNEYLAYDWGNCETLQTVKAFTITDYGTTSSDQTSDDEFMVPDPSISGIESLTSFKIPPPRTISAVEENYVVDDMSSLSRISDIRVSSAPQKHIYAKERVERKGNIYDKLYNAALKGELSIVKRFLENHGTTLMTDEHGQSPLYAACIGNHTEIVKLLIDFRYDINHQDKDGKTPLHITFENHAPQLAHTLITEFKANTEIRDKQNWTPLHTAIDRGYSRYSQELLEKFLQEDIDTDVSWIQLHAACLEENKQDVQFLLAASTDVNHSSSAGYAPLHIALAKSNIDLVTLLLDQTVDINYETIDHQTPLHISVENGNEIIIQKLLAWKADPNLKNVLGNTSLHLAVQLNNETGSWLLGEDDISSSCVSCQPCSIQTVHAIIDHGAFVNAVNNKGQTALWLACYNGQEEFAKILLDTGADPNIADKYGDSCLHAAMHGRCNRETIKQILDHGAHVNVINKDETTPLLLACSTAQTESVSLLLKAKADPNIADADGDACLHVATASDCLKEILPEIIDYGADLNSTNKRGRTALLLSCFYSQRDSVKALLREGADPAIGDEEGFSCIDAAVDGRCSKDTLQALFDHGAPLNGKRKDGTNALLRACKTGQSESVMFLLEAGADVNIAKPDGNTCLHEAVYGHCSGKTLQKLTHKGVDINAVNNNSETVLMLSCYAAQEEFVKVLLKNGADCNICDADKYTSLHAAVHGCCTIEILQEIIDHHAHLNAQGINGETALLLACSYRQQDSAKILLEAGSNPNIADNDGITSLQAAVDGRCRKTTLQVLIEYGADIDAKRSDGENSLLRACRTGQSESVKFLLEAGADVNNPQPNGNTILHAAVDGGCSKEALQTIIQNGVNVNDVNNSNETALILACYRAQEELVKVLLEERADPNISAANSCTSLHGAVRGHCTCETLQEIIAHKVYLDGQNIDGKTALWLACSYMQQDSVKILLEAGSNPNIASADGNTSLHAAISGGSSRGIILALIHHAVNVNATNMSNETALVLAAKNGYAEAMNVLLRSCADPNIADVDRDTCLHKAVRQNCGKELLQTILDYGANVNAANTNNTTALMIACDKGDVDAMNVLMDAGASFKLADADGYTCLHKAVRKDCSKEVLHTIIDHGADVNAMNKNNRTALVIACVKKNEGAIHVLLNAGADPNLADVDGDTGLHYGVMLNCSKDALQALIDHGAHVDAVNKCSETALMIAFMKGTVDAICVLTKAGANPNVKDADDNTCLHKIVRASCKEVIQTIIDLGADVNAINKYHETVLLIACMHGKIDAINVLLEAEADTNITEIDGHTCLHKAVNANCGTRVVQAIIDHGADVNAINKYNKTALLIACMDGKIDAINVLLEAGADTNITETDGHTCLHKAVNANCDEQTVQAIIDHGADVNAINKDNETALLIACMNGQNDAINVLLKAGADTNITETDGHTCLHIAVNANCGKRAVQAIIDHGADVNAINKDNETALLIACMDGKIDAINVLLEAGADTNITEPDGYTCLHKAVNANCDKRAVQALIDHGADVNAINKDNETALLIACMHGKIDAINVLLEAGADTNITETYGHTCLHKAVNANCDEQTVQAIIDHGADVNATNKDNETALLIACMNGETDAINVLLEAGADTNITETDGHTCLHIAVNANCGKRAVQAIIDHGADVNATNKKNVTASMIACDKGNIDIINILMSVVDADGDTCLHKAVGRSCGKEVLQTMVDHGVNVNAANTYNITALMIACDKGDVDAINVLLKAGADTNIAQTGGYTCLHKAVSANCGKQTVQAILDHGADVDAINKYNKTALLIACMHGKIDAINVLLKAGADTNITETYGHTCLHKAVNANCDEQTVQAIIDHGADVNAINKDNETALLIACMDGQNDAINVLLKAGADTNITETDGHTCLHKAVNANCGKQTVQAILDHGADVDAINKYNKTALLIACMDGKIDAINVLLEAGADTNIADTYGHTCLHKAVNANCDKQTVQTIIDHGADVNAINKYNETALLIACINGRTDAINVLLEAGADTNIADTYGHTCLHKAVNANCGKQTVQTIIDHRAHVNAINKYNETALLIACINGKTDAINVLLEAGADANITQTGGYTCLHKAVNANCGKQTVQAILDHGADVNAINKYHETALLIACINGKADAINVLLKAGADTNIAQTGGYTCLHKAVNANCGKQTVQAIIDHGADVNAINKYNKTALLIACMDGKIDAINVLLKAGADTNITETYGHTCLHKAVNAKL